MSREPLSALHRSLRAATRSDHMEVDELIGRLDLTRREGYGCLLSIHHAVLQNLKSEWRPEDRDDFRAMSRRSQNDLRLLGLPTATPPSMTRDPLSQGSQLGIAYVIRGSRLGANVIGREYHRNFPPPISILSPHSPGSNFLRKCKAFQTSPEPKPAMRPYKGRKLPSICFRVCLQKPWRSVFGVSPDSGARRIGGDFPVILIKRLPAS